MTKPLTRLSSTPTQDELANRVSSAQSWVNEAETKGLYPWDGANPKVVAGYPLKIKEPLYMKMKFIVEREPNMSIQKFIISAIETKVDDWIAQHLNRG